jgi:hypothetical protein
MTLSSAAVDAVVVDVASFGETEVEGALVVVEVLSEEIDVGDTGGGTKPRKR